MMPCSFTPFTKNTVTGILLLRMLFKKTSWTLCDFSLAMRFRPLFLGLRKPAMGAPRGRGAALPTINIGRRPRKLRLLQISQKANAIREIEGGLMPRELAVPGGGGPHQHRGAARIGSTFEVDIGIAHQPDVRAAGQIASA